MEKRKPIIALEHMKPCDYHHNQFRVASLTNTLLYPIGEYLDATEVQALIDKGWTVKIK